MTKRQYLEDIRHIIQAFDDPEYDRHLEFLDKEIAALNKPHNKTHTAKTNGLIEEIKSVLINYNAPMTITEIGIAADCTNAQVINCLNTLILQGLVIKYITKVNNKKVTLYTISNHN